MLYEEYIIKYSTTGLTNFAIIEYQIKDTYLSMDWKRLSVIDLEGNY